MTRLSILLGTFAIGLLMVADASAQVCPNQSGRTASSGSSVQSPGVQSPGLGGFSGGGQGGRLLTGPGSHFHDLMMANFMRQQYARQQAMVAAAKQAKRNARKQSQLETRRRQREAELARREEKKRQAQLVAQLKAGKPPK